MWLETCWDSLLFHQASRSLFLPKIKIISLMIKQLTTRVCKVACCCDSAFRKLLPVAERRLPRIMWARKIFTRRRKLEFIFDAFLGEIFIAGSSQKFHRREVGGGGSIDDILTFLSRWLRRAARQKSRKTFHSVWKFMKFSARYSRCREVTAARRRRKPEKQK